MAIGDLTQILTEDKMDTATVEFNDYEASQTGMPDLPTALTNITSNSIFGNVFSNVKASLKRLKELTDTKLNISKVIASTNLTEVGTVMDGVTCTQEFSAINANLANVGIVSDLSASDFGLPTPSTFTKVINDTTIAQTGLYFLCSSVTLTAVQDSTRLIARLYKNGSLLYSQEMTIGQTYCSTSLNLPILLNANDIINVQLYSETVVAVGIGNRATLKIARMK